MKNPIMVMTLYVIHRHLGVGMFKAISMAWRQA